MCLIHIKARSIFHMTVEFHKARPIIHMTVEFHVFAVINATRAGG